MTMSGLSLPNLGDQTLVFRAKAKSEGIEIVVDIVCVAIAHNIVSFTAAGLQPLAGPEMEKIARTGMAKVAAAAKGCPGKKEGTNSMTTKGNCHVDIFRT